MLVGVVEVGVVAAPPVGVALGTCVVGGSRMSVYYDPSAVFCSVSGVPMCSVTVGAPSA